MAIESRKRVCSIIRKDARATTIRVCSSLTHKVSRNIVRQLPRQLPEINDKARRNESEECIDVSKTKSNDLIAETDTNAIRKP